MAGARPLAGGPAVSLTRVAARLTTPLAYVAVFGGLQVLLLWTLRAHVGTWVAAISTGGVLALLGLIVLVEGRWGLKLGVTAVLGALTAIGPTLVAVVQRPVLGLTMEHDGLLQIESAIDRLLHGQPIYGVDWSTTPMARLPWNLTTDGNPALHHMAYFPLTILVGIPFRLLSGALGLPFDYRIVVISLAPIVTIVPFLLVNPQAFWTDVVLYTSGGVPDAYPIQGYGFGEILYDPHLIAHRTDAFPFTAFQLAALVPVLWLAGRALVR